MSESQARTDSQTVSLADEDNVKDVLVKSVQGLWKVVNDLTRLRPTKRDRYRVTIFGSAREARHVRLRRGQAGRGRVDRDGL